MPGRGCRITNVVNLYIPLLTILKLSPDWVISVELIIKSEGLNVMTLGMVLLAFWELLDWANKLSFAVGPWSAFSLIFLHTLPSKWKYPTYFTFTVCLAGAVSAAVTYNIAPVWAAVYVFALSCAPVSLGGIIPSSEVVVVAFPLTSKVELGLVVPTPTFPWGSLACYAAVGVPVVELSFAPSTTWKTPWGIVVLTPTWEKAVVEKKPKSLRK